MTRPKRGATVLIFPPPSDPALRGSEFDDALSLAITTGALEPLRRFVAAGKLIPKETVHVTGRPVQSMESLVATLLGQQDATPPRRRGRSRRVPAQASAIEQAERNAAWFVAFKLEAWRRRHNRRRVKTSERNAISAEAIKEAAAAFNVPVDAIKTRNIRNLLRNRTIVVS